MCLTDPLMWLYSRICMSHSSVNILYPFMTLSHWNVVPLPRPPFLLQCPANSAQASRSSVTLFICDLSPESYGQAVFACCEFSLLHHVLHCIPISLFLHLCLFFTYSCFKCLWQFGTQDFIPFLIRMPRCPMICMPDSPLKEVTSFWNLHYLFLVI